MSMDIIALSQLGESSTLEYKRNADALTTILKCVSAFANTTGGIILIGVEDNGEVVGVSDTGQIQEKLANAISDRIKPQLFPEISVTETNGKSVISVQIEHSPGPYYLSDKGEAKGSYIRVGNSSRLAGPEILQEIKRMATSISFDKSPCDGVTENDLDKAAINSIYMKRSRTVNTAKLMSLGILTKKGQRIVASHGGIILFGLPEIREHYFPYAEVRCARFKGISRSEFIDRLNVEGGVLAAIDEVPKFIRRNTKMVGKFGSMRRQDIPEYPTEGIREALANAIAHANYEVTGSRLFIAIYDDRLEIQNPGIMMPGMSIEQFKAGVSRIRNPVIVKTLSQLELIEEWGSGYERIKEACEKGGYPLPKWEELGSALRVTFYPHPEAIELGASWVPAGCQLGASWHPADDDLEKLGEDEKRLIAFCRKERSFQELLDYMAWRDRTKFRRKFIIPLLQIKFLEQTVPDKPTSPNQKYKATEPGIKWVESKR